MPAEESSGIAKVCEFPKLGLLSRNDKGLLLRVKDQDLGVIFFAWSEPGNLRWMANAFRL